ncbi:MAG TPA: TolC family outer membrane protein [Eoetvoesiella sp.]
MKLAVFVGTASLAGPTWAQATDSLDRVVEKTILSNPEIRARYQNFQSSLEGQKVGRGALLPQVNAQGWTGREWRSNVENSPDYDWNRHGYSIELKQLLFDGFSTINNVKQLGFEKLSGYYELLATTDNLAAEAAGAYLDVQRYRQMERLARENFGMHQTTLGHIRERQQSGVGRGVDLEQANGRLALAQSNLMTESNNLNDVTQRYRRLVGDFPSETLVESPSLTALLPAKPTDFKTSIRGNPTVLSKQALVQAAQAGKASAQGHFAPTVELRASTGKDRAQLGPTFNNVQSTNVQVVMSYNLFRGGSDAARVRQTAAQWYAARDVRDYTCRNVQQDLSVAWNNIMRLREQIPFLREHELATSKVRTAYQQQFQIGQRSLLDLLDTENELFDARRALLNGMYDLKKLEYRWLALSHQVLPALGLAQPNKEAPKEESKLDFPEESVNACLTPTPDTRNLTPVKVSYNEGMLPPTLAITDQEGAVPSPVR